MNKILEKELEHAWYLVKTFPGKESFAVDFIKSIADEENCSEDIADFFIPNFLNHDKNHDKKNKCTSLMMGYFAMKLKLTPKFLKVINKVETARVHLGGTKVNKNGKIVHSKSIVNHKTTFDIRTKMNEGDLSKMMKSSEVYNKIKNVYHLRERVIITDGPLKNLTGTIHKICDNGKLSIKVEIVSRHVFIELDTSKIRKEDQ